MIFKRTGHEISKVIKRLAENHIAMFGDTFLELLLQVSTAMLVLAKRWDLSNKVLQTCTREPID
jgi:hypothetical protein